MLNHNLSQKIKLIGNDQFNHLINTLTFSLMCEIKLHFAQQVKCLIEMGGNYEVRV